MRVAVVGAAQTKYESAKSGQTIPEMVYEVVRAALNDANISIKDVDDTVTASVDLFDGRTASSVYVTEVTGSVMKPETRIAADGIAACFHAWMSILSGAYGVVLVAAHCKMSEGKYFDLTNWVFDPIYQQTLGLDYLSAAALQANLYMNRYGITEEQCARAVVRNLKNAKNNPYALKKKNTQLSDVLDSEPLAYPIRELDAAPAADGACALILAGEKAASRMNSRPAWIRAAANCLDSHYLGDRDLSECRALSGAAEQAYTMAGIKNPADEIDVAEISCDFSCQELMFVEALGFCEKGGGGVLIESGETELDGKIPINPSGGRFAGSPYIVSGAARVAEAYLQLTGAAGEKQIHDAKLALAHGTTGPAGQGHCVMILESGL